MSENHSSDVKPVETPNGSVTFATEVIATIVGLAVMEVEGVAGMNSTGTGFADMFTKKSTRNITKGVKVDVADNAVVADITITVEYGFPIPEVAGGIQENVKKAVETMSGLNVSAVNVHVTAISFENEMKAARELDEQQKRMLAQQAERRPAKPAEPEVVHAAEPVDEPEDDEDEALEEETEVEEAEIDDAVEAEAPVSDEE